MVHSSASGASEGQISASNYVFFHPLFWQGTHCATGPGNSDCSSGCDLCTCLHSPKLYVWDWSLIFPLHPSVIQTQFVWSNFDNHVVTSSDLWKLFMFLCSWYIWFLSGDYLRKRRCFFLFSSDIFTCRILNMTLYLWSRRVSGQCGRMKAQEDSLQVRCVMLSGLTARGPCLSFRWSLNAQLTHFSILHQY